MMFKTHIAFGFLIGLLALKFFNVSNPVLFITLVVLASALPDIDHPNSKLGKKVKIIFLFFEHRGFFHGIFAAFLFGGLAYYFLKGYFLAVFIGYLSHLIIDAITLEGIMPLHPISRFRLKGIFRTGSVFEYIIFVLITIANGYFLLN